MANAATKQLSKQQEQDKKALEARYMALKDYLSKRSKAIADQLPAGTYSPEQFLTAASVTIRKSITDWSDGLVACNPESLFLTLMDVASLGLLPSWGVRGECALVPFKEQATLIIGYRGYVRLFLRSGVIRQVTANAVWHGDGWDFYEDEKGVHYHFRPEAERTESEDPEKQLRNVRLFYAAAHFRKEHGVGVQVAEVSIAKYQKIRATVLSKIQNDYGKKQSPHMLWPLEQGVKSAIRQLSKLVPTYETDSAAELEAKYEKDVQGISWEEADRKSSAQNPAMAFRQAEALPSYTPRETLEVEARPEPIAVEAKAEVKQESRALADPIPGGDPDSMADALIASINAAAGAGDERRLKDLAAEAEKLPPDLKDKVGDAYAVAKRALKERKGGASNG